MIGVPSLRERFQWRQALLAAPAMIMIIAYGLFTGKVTESAIAAGAALSVGMVASRSLGYFRWDSVLLVALGTALTSVLGSLAGESLSLYALGVFCAAAGVGMGSLGHPQFWLVYLQLAIAFIVAGHFPSDLSTAMSHSKIVLMGSLTQAATIAVIALLLPRLAKTMPPITPHMGAVSPVVFGLVAGVVVSAALCAAERLGLSSIYWPAMTALLLLRPNLVHTQQRVIQRTVGTVAGCFLAFIVVSIAPREPAYLAITLMVAFALTFALQPTPRTSYGWFSGAVTTSVLLLLAFARTDIVQDAELRLFSTVMGAALAWAGALFLEYVLAKPDSDATEGI